MLFVRGGYFKWADACFCQYYTDIFIIYLETEEAVGYRAVCRTETRPTQLDPQDLGKTEITVRQQLNVDVSKQLLTLVAVSYTHLTLPTIYSV